MSGFVGRLGSVALGALIVVSCVRPGVEGSTPASGSPYKNIRYTIEGHTVELEDGVAESAGAPGSASRVHTRYLGYELHKDLDGDGRGDVAFILIQDRGGSGTFYYVVASLQTEDGWMGSHAMLLGDRIRPIGIEPGPGRSIVVSYLEHASGEPMTGPPSRERSRQLLLDDESLQFEEVALDVEGEAASV